MCFLTLELFVELKSQTEQRNAVVGWASVAGQPVAVLLSGGRARVGPRSAVLLHVISQRLAIFGRVRTIGALEKCRTTDRIVQLRPRNRADTGRRRLVNSTDRCAVGHGDDVISGRRSGARVNWGIHAGFTAVVVVCVVIVVCVATVVIVVVTMMIVVVVTVMIVVVRSSLSGYNSKDDNGTDIQLCVLDGAGSAKKCNWTDNRKLDKCESGSKWSAKALVGLPPHFSDRRTRSPDPRKALATPRRSPSCRSTCRQPALSSPLLCCSSSSSSSSTGIGDKATNGNATDKGNSGIGGGGDGDSATVSGDSAAAAASTTIVDVFGETSFVSSTTVGVTSTDTSLLLSTTIVVISLPVNKHSKQTNKNYYIKQQQQQQRERKREREREEEDKNAQFDAAEQKSDADDKRTDRWLPCQKRRSLDNNRSSGSSLCTTLDVDNNAALPYGSSQRLWSINK
ncbi:hypothetical protein T11_12156 [Trichinella zimbabwensis]|uniref:Uncharacterized protein n=1 Tax=Trichinella zimbabwensis TaxID=268475 RepID=A0A0V1I5C7_9BILA|nr:hypothetical protein T11_12156 [Trichinella zimbabwensis]